MKNLRIQMGTVEAITMKLSQHGKDKEDEMIDVAITIRLEDEGEALILCKRHTSETPQYLNNKFGYAVPPDFSVGQKLMMACELDVSDTHYSPLVNFLYSDRMKIKTFN